MRCPKCRRQTASLEDFLEGWNLYRLFVSDMCPRCRVRLRPSFAMGCWLGAHLLAVAASLLAAWRIHVAWNLVGFEPFAIVFVVVGTVPILATAYWLWNSEYRLRDRPQTLDDDF